MANQTQPGRSKDPKNLTDTLNTRAKSFTRSIMDLSFQEYLTMKLLPVFYVLLLVGLTVVAVIINIGAWQLSTTAGIVVLLGTPFGLAIAFAVVRAALEFLVMAYRIMLTLERMDRIPDQVDNLNSKVDGISERVDEVTDVVNILKPLVGVQHLPGKILNRKNK